MNDSIAMKFVNCAENLLDAFGCLRFRVESLFHDPLEKFASCHQLQHHQNPGGSLEHLLQPQDVGMLHPEVIEVME